VVRKERDLESEVWTETQGLWKKKKRKKKSQGNGIDVDTIMLKEAIEQGLKVSPLSCYLFPNNILLFLLPLSSSYFLLIKTCNTL